MSEAAARYLHLRDLLLVLIQKEIKIRYKSTWLGYVWSLANPLAFMGLYSLVFGIFLRLETPGHPYALFLIAGLFPWQWLANAVNSAPGIFLSNAALIKKVRFPRNLLVMSVVLNEGLHFALSIPVIVIATLVHGQTPSWTWLPGIALLLPVQAATAYGLAAAIASINLFFRDLERLTILMTTFLFFLTPIVYPVSMMPEAYRPLVYLNPAGPLMLSWQRLFLSGELEPTLLLAAHAHALVMLGLGTVVYRRLSWRFAEVV
jgi:lipopolysaccharide transport system permease protein